MRSKEREKSNIRKHARSRIPPFKTVEEEAKFWDTHSTTEFEEEFLKVNDVKFVKPGIKKAITVRLESNSLVTLTRQAEEKGIGPSTLARMWILERLNERKAQVNARAR